MVSRLVGMVLMVTSLLWGYIDSDLDGVDDTIDRCPYTPFDEIVEADGCSPHDHFPGRLIVEVGSDMGFDAEEESVNSMAFYMAYQVGAWRFSIADSHYDSVTLSSGDTTADTLYLTAGYGTTHANLDMRLSLGMRIDVAQESKESDYYIALNTEYAMNDRASLLFYYAYTISGEDDTIVYQNYHSTSLGYSYLVTPKWYTSLSYTYTQSRTPNGDAYQSLSWYHSYQWSRMLYGVLYYTYGVNQSAYDHTVGVSIGICFD